jgi:hypothetical protein
MRRVTVEERKDEGAEGVSPSGRGRGYKVRPMDGVLRVPEPVQSRRRNTWSARRGGGDAANAGMLDEPIGSERKGGRLADHEQRPRGAVGVDEGAVARDGLDSAPLVCAGKTGTEFSPWLLGAGTVAPGLLTDSVAAQDATAGPVALDGGVVLHMEASAARGLRIQFGVLAITIP